MLSQYITYITVGLHLQPHTHRFVCEQLKGKTSKTINEAYYPCSVDKAWWPHRCISLFTRPLANADKQWHNVTYILRVIASFCRKHIQDVNRTWTMMPAKRKSVLHSTCCYKATTNLCLWVKMYFIWNSQNAIYIILYLEALLNYTGRDGVKKE